jgi:hypothetical protein
MSYTTSVRHRLCTVQLSLLNPDGRSVAAQEYCNADPTPSGVAEERSAASEPTSPGCVAGAAIGDTLWDYLSVGTRAGRPAMGRRW